MFKKLKAKWNKAPYKVDRYWPAYCLYINNTTKKQYDIEYECLLKRIDFKVGDIVDVYHDFKLNVHRYKIVCKYKLSGSDHIMSPLVYDLIYDSTIVVDPDTYVSTIPDDLHEPQLIINR